MQSHTPSGYQALCTRQQGGYVALALFGYQPYGAGGVGENQGYVLYGQGPSSRDPIYANNRVIRVRGIPGLVARRLGS